MEYTDVFIIALIVALVEFFKYLGAGPKLSAVLSLLFGVIAGLFLFSPTDPINGLVMGIVFGLSASGFYSQGKTYLKGEGHEIK